MALLEDLIAVGRRAGRELPARHARAARIRTRRARALNQRLIYCSISGYGATGPRTRSARLRHGDPGRVRADGRHRLSRDRTDEGRRGDHRLPRRRCTRCRASCSRTSAGAQTGKGQFLDIALLDSAVSVLGLPARHRRGDGQEPRPARQRTSVARAVRAVFRLPTARSSLPSPTRDCGRGSVRQLAPKGSSRIRGSRQIPIGFANRAVSSTQYIRDLFRDQTVDSLIDRLGEAGVPCGRVRTIDQVLQDPQLAARQMLLDIAAGESSVKVPGNPIKLSGVPTLASAPPPALGEHTEEVRRTTRRGRR